MESDNSSVGNYGAVIPAGSPNLQGSQREVKMLSRAEPSRADYCDGETAIVGEFRFMMPRHSSSTSKKVLSSLNNHQVSFFSSQVLFLNHLLKSWTERIPQALLVEDKQRHPLPRLSSLTFTSKMDLNLTDILLHKPQLTSSSRWKNGNGESPLSLEYSGHGNNRIKSSSFYQSNPECFSGQEDGCRLVLGLGPTPASYCADYPSKDPSNKPTYGADAGMLQLGLAGVRSDPVLSLKRAQFPVDDECSTSARKTGGFIPSLLFAPACESPRFCLSPEPSETTDSSLATNSSLQRNPPKKCRFEGCSKGARGASGLCIAHGGGQRCQKPGCNKGAESRTAYCKAHGGGRRCQLLGCTKSAEGKTDYCIAHGGGRRCGHYDCSKAARGKTGLCIRHGGGKRCAVEGCTRSAEGQAGLCISHGGGRRCQFAGGGCAKGAQGSTLFCKAHGGGRRCVFEGCRKGAEGSTPLCKAHGGGRRCMHEGGGVCPKSVHGGTNFCVAHGGGKRCVVPGCTRSARGRTDRCVRHGGGKRCRHEGCGKSAQGSTDYCKAHGGGKRCCWEGGCEKFARGRIGLCAAHGNAASAASRGKISSGLCHVDCLSGMSVQSDCSAVESSESLENRGYLIPPLVLVPPDMKMSSSSAAGEKGNIGYVIPEGRVHGGGLMSLLGGCIRRG
ncbi:putative WRKY transcription factor 19 [Apostasia shenzhenica]|uniref:Putative WRKY transcription factor 19 n=1 Tax=Apostasia shenzhenica TaxID=1088818 RepID=A0A2I0AY42_9ASPA|nr:putative WRKY transcription factor 19 [Apostasia shenzhenica]